MKTHRCKSCDAQYLQQYKKRNFARLKEGQREYYARNKEKVKGKVKIWADNNRVRVRQIKTAYKARNPELAWKYDAKRRAILEPQIMNVSNREWQAIVRYFGGRCAYCLKQPARLTLDHVIPLSRGGKHVSENIVPACRPCNSGKGARLIFSMLNKCA